MKLLYDNLDYRNDAVSLSQAGVPLYVDGKFIKYLYIGG